ncbi:MAG TPA: isoprenoid biosynthesis glyoxalase ElbB [Bacteroidales bacterium]|nr:isoprenoid biosynthesis glyoxalase ElbB [Bacteroidales bacterium]HQQ21251.1 isoprenoid biosynthesis glyoxalase ElbB [Bacteroidales bacterium]
MKKIAVILCGSGSMDGSEIHESVMTLLAIDKAGHQYQIFSPDGPQHHVVNHITQQETGSQRNMLEESGRIARGDVKPLDQLQMSQFDGVIFPGGFGAAKNLMTYAFDGVNAKVRDDIAALIREAHQAKKPIGALCIAPVLIAKVLKNITVTIGSDPQTIKNIEQIGAKHVVTKQTEVYSDIDNLVFTTPCYMLPATIKDIAACADNLLLAMKDYL